MEIVKLNYEFSNFDEADKAIKEYERSKPPNVAPYPKFEIDYIDVEKDELRIWLKLKNRE